MDVPVIAMADPKILYGSDHLLHSIIRIPDYSGTEKKPFDIIPAVKTDGKIRNLLRSESGSGMIITPSVNAIGTVVYTIIAEHHLHKGYTTSIFRKTVTDSPRGSIANCPCLVGSLGAA